MDESQYEQLRKEVNWETNRPSGALFHAAATDQDGHVQVADLWESEAQLNDFVMSRLMPAFMKHQLNPPDVSLYPTLKVNSYPELDKFRL
jgi:hypothetical protein